MPTHVDNELSGAVIGAAIKVHREFGPGLDEPIYQEALSLQLLADGINHHPEWPLPLHYKGTHLDCGYRPDIFIPQRLVVELKSVEAIHPIHEAQLLTYLRLTGVELGLLLNFDVPYLKDGIRRRLLSAAHENYSTRRAPIDDNSDDSGEDELTRAIVAAGMEVHSVLGPGLLASAYEECLCHELSLRRIPFQRRRLLTLEIAGVTLQHRAKLPLLVAGEVLVQPLAVETITELHSARLLGRLRQAKLARGLLLNFNSLTLGDGLRRIINPNRPR